MQVPQEKIKRFSLLYNSLSPANCVQYRYNFNNKKTNTKTIGVNIALIVTLRIYIDNNIGHNLHSF